MFYLYSIPLPEVATADQQDTLSAILSENPVLQSDAAVEQLSSQAGDLTLTGQWRYGAPYSEQVATELEELADASMGALPLFRTDDPSATASVAGYYEIAEADVSPAHANADDVYEYDLSLTRVGSRNTEWRAVETRPRQPDPGHSFGDTESARIGLPGAASKVRAVDTEIGPAERVRLTADVTLPAEFGDADVFDVLTLDIDDPIVLYDLPYEEVAKTDARVYDTLGNADKYVTASDGSRVRQWQHVFAPGHDPVGEVVMDNGLLRVTLDEATGSVAAEGFTNGSYGSGPYGAGPYGGWEDSEDAGQWYEALVGETDWTLLDVDLTHISPVRAAAQLEFEHDTEGLYAVDVALDRGMNRLRVFAPESESDPIPSGLADLFEPIASESVYDTNLEQTLVSREEVRR